MGQVLFGIRMIMIFLIYRRSCIIPVCLLSQSGNKVRQVCDKNETPSWTLSAFGHSIQSHDITRSISPQDGDSEHGEASLRSQKEADVHFPMRAALAFLIAAMSHLPST